MKMSNLNRILLLGMVFLAGYQVVVGIDQFAALPIIAYTIAFGVLIIAGLLLIILGFEVLDSPLVVIVSTITPLALAIGLIWQYLPTLRVTYLVFTILGFLAVVVSRPLTAKSRFPTAVLALVHGIAGLTIFLLPILLALQGVVKPLFALVGVGGGLIGLGGLLLSFQRAGKPVLTRERILKVLPGLLLVTTACFVAGFWFG